MIGLEMALERVGVAPFVKKWWKLGLDGLGM